MSHPSLRERAGAWIEGEPVQRLIIALILLNAVTLGMETSDALMSRFGDVLHLVDRVILALFVAELGTKIYAFGPRFFRSPWNLFDFVVVGVALIPASGPLAVLRSLRILRVLRLISVLPRLRFVVEALLRSVPGISSIGLLLAVLFYVFGVMSTELFGERFPEWFGSIARSMYTLFQVMTLESWSMGIVRPVMEVYPYAWVFFVPFILVTTFTILNLFIGIIVDTMQAMHSADLEREREQIEEAVHRDASQLEGEIRALREEIRALREAVAERR